MVPPGGEVSEKKTLIRCSSSPPPSTFLNSHEHPPPPSSPPRVYSLPELMAIEAVVFQQQDPFGHAAAWPHHHHPHLHTTTTTTNNNNPEKEDLHNDSLAQVLRSQHRRRVRHGSSTVFTSDDPPPPCKPKRRRCRSRKNKEEMENQRMTHIAVERNRRRQMNDYLTVLRSLMPLSYVQRGDQASTIGGAINFLKELEQRLHFLTTTTTTTTTTTATHLQKTSIESSHFSEFFSFPQFSTSAGGTPATADVEVTMVESHANIKIRSRRRPNQLHSVVAGLQMLRLAILHLNITTADDVVLYSVSVKVEDECRFTSVDEIAAAVHQLLCTNIQEK